MSNRIPPDHMTRDHVTMRLPRWLLEWIKGQAIPKADLVEAALKKAFRLKEPK